MTGYPSSLISEETLTVSFFLSMFYCLGYITSMWD